METNKKERVYRKMKRIIRYRYLTIAKKMIGEIRVVIDEKSEYNSSFEGGTSKNLSILPIIGLSIQRPSIQNEDGTFSRPPWNPNDSLGMTKFNLPIMIRELKCIQKDIAVKDVFKYVKERLELDVKISETIRRVFMIGSTTLELTPIVIEENDLQLEGVKIKFNNESSTINLTLNELYSLIHNLDNLDVDSITISLYYNEKKDNKGSNDIVTNNKFDIKSDIVPLKRVFEEDSLI